MKRCVYLVIGATVYEAGLDGSQRRLSTDFARASSLTRAGDNLFLFEGATLYRLSIETGEYTRVSSGWREGDMLSAVGDRVFVLEASTIYEALADGDYARRLAQMGGTTLFASSANRLFCLEDGMLEELFVDDQSYRVVCEARDAVCIAAGGELVYTMSDDGEIYEIEPSSGQGKKVSYGWNNPKGLACLDGELVVLDGASLCRVKDDGEHEVLSRGWADVRLMTDH